MFRKDAFREERSSWKPRRIAEVIHRHIRDRASDLKSRPLNRSDLDTSPTLACIGERGKLTPWPALDRSRREGRPRLPVRVSTGVETCIDLKFNL